jgi:CO/xanthine dehydrogenase FAD-binding subunit
MRAFEYLEASSAAEACAMLAEAGPDARLLAGGTDLLIQMEMGRVRPSTLVYLGRADELRRMEFDLGRGLRIGAGATLREIELHPAVAEHYPSLQRGAAEVGSVQIRNLATLAGNICNASPSADTSPALLAHDAEVEIASRDGVRVVPIQAFWLGPGSTVLRTGEIVSAVRLPVPAAGTRAFYQKLAVRKAMDLAMVGVCVTAAANGTPGSIRIVLGAVAPVCMRATEAEQIAASSTSEDAIDAAARAAAAACSPISDQRASAEYRREMVRVLTRRALRQVLGS